MTDCSVLHLIWIWSGRLVARRPKTVLLVVAMVSTGCFICSLCLAPLPSFANPSLGFEARGTELGKRLIAFENMWDSIGSPLAATSRRPLLSQVPVKKARRRRRAKPRRPIRFCLQPSKEYSQVVVSGRDLWSPAEVRAQCLIESHLTSPAAYSQLCDRSAGTCCPAWSLPNTIAFLHNRTSCRHIKDEDVTETRKLVEECRQYFVFGDREDQVPTYPAKQIPPKCRRKKSVFNLLYYILDSNYQSAADMLENVLVILPVAQSSASLPYYNSLPLSSLHIRNTSVSALNFGVKDAVFSELIVRDSWLLVCGAALVAACLFIYTASIILTAAVILSVLFSLILAYFLYTVVFRFTFFPFINVLSSVVAIGVGSDSSLILFKVWSTQTVHHCLESKAPVLESVAAECRPDDAAQQTRIIQEDAVIALYNVSSLGLILTSLTTAAAFFASYKSNITSLACFGVFSGSVVLSNMVVTWWWVPACLVLSDPGQKSLVHNGSWRLVLEARWLWLVIFPTVTLFSGLVIYHHGGLPMPETPAFHLLLPTHPIERFHVYSNRFNLYKHQTSHHMLLRWIWGVEARDSGDAVDPDSRGSLHLDRTFDPTQLDSQLFLSNFCKNIRREEWYGGGAAVVGGRCLPESVADWMKRRCVLESDRPCCHVSAPLPSSEYTECAARAADSIHHSYISHRLAGFYFLHPSHNTTIRALIIEFDSNRTFTTSYSDMDSFYREVEEWTKEQLKMAPSSVSKGWFLSDLGLFDLQHSLRHDTAASVIAASLLVLLLLMVATRDLRLASAATITVGSSTLCTAALLILLGWKLDVLESSTASLAVGLSVDFTIHYALHYKACGETRSTLDSIAGPLLSCMATSCLAGAAMLPSQTLPYRRVAAFLLILMPVSYLYSSLFFLSLLRQTPRSR